MVGSSNNVHLLIRHTSLVVILWAPSPTTVYCLAQPPPGCRGPSLPPPPAMTSPAGGEGHSSQGPQSGLDGWIEQQQRQFRDFDSSFGVSSGFADFDTFPRISSIFAPSPRQALAPPPPSSSLLPAAAAAASVNRSNMALQSGDSDMSPKAKVSYDQDKFQVEFNVQDYTPEVSPTPKLVLSRPLVNI